MPSDIVFKHNMQLVVDAWGERFFTKHKMLLIKNHCQHLDDKSFTKMIDEILNSERYAPLPKTFAEYAAKFREKSIQKKKDELKRSNSLGYEGINRALKSMSEALEKNQVHQIKAISDFCDSKLRPICKDCGESGIVWTENVPYKCYCEFGKQRTEDWPIHESSNR